MYGLIAKLTLLPGKRDEMIAILKEGTAAMPGCLSYVVAKNSADENTIWVTEVWDSLASHDASLTLRFCKRGVLNFPRSHTYSRIRIRLTSTTTSFPRKCSIAGWLLKYSVSLAINGSRTSA